MKKKQFIVALGVSTLALAQAGLISADEVVPVDPTTPSMEVVAPETTVPEVSTPTPPVDTSEPVSPVDPTQPSTEVETPNSNTDSQDGVTSPGTTMPPQESDRPSNSEVSPAENEKDKPTPAPQGRDDTDNKPKEEIQTTDQANQTGKSQVDTTSSVTGQVVQNVSAEAPIQTNTGVKIVSTENGLVKLSDGSLVTPEAVGAVTNADKTISVTKADGKKATLPHTGEAQSLLSFLGVALLTVVGYVFRKKQV
ncbi:LPXTG cell wall anchor domain-containing protein [Streptococcus hongkongensis]|nr:hypothetical protein NC01_08495 [Streptococcus uberis]